MLALLFDLSIHRKRFAVALSLLSAAGRVSMGSKWLGAHRQLTAGIVEDLVVDGMPQEDSSEDDVVSRSHVLRQIVKPCKSSSLSRSIVV